MQIETILSPNLFSQIVNLENKVVVVIDVLRATSTITTILANGATALIPVKKESDAVSYKNKGYLVGGERGGETIEGFDFGNSPFHYKKELVEGKEVVLTTTNGTKIIEMSANAKQVIVGSFLNLDAIVRHLRNLNSDVVLFCAGWQDRVNLEDSLFAGAVASQLIEASFDDSTLLTMDAYNASKSNLFDALKKSNHFQRLASKGVTKDIEYCCQENVFDILPVLRDGKIVLS
ncbi:MAG: 2-phosphosulfolactate phosphatase [Bacteroidia bacterium]|nr:2-phosphosulfolactate phosphatase [Bacteroidia bacterium]NNJ55493.1 2-phosphosulfolactate phosphatase [Bacteroidia bacterium]